jgi:hypothetical protein
MMVYVITVTTLIRRVVFYEEVDNGNFYINKSP